MWVLLLVGLVVTMPVGGPRLRLGSESRALQLALWYERIRRIARHSGPDATTRLELIAAREAQSPGTGSLDASLLAGDLWRCSFGVPLGGSAGGPAWGPRTVLECGSGSSSGMNGTVVRWYRFQEGEQGVRVIRLSVFVPGKRERFFARMRWTIRTGRMVNLLPAALRGAAWEAAERLHSPADPVPVVTAQGAVLPAPTLRAVMRVLERLEAGRPPPDPDLPAKVGPWTEDWEFVRLEQDGRPPREHADPDRRDATGTADLRFTRATSVLVDLALEGTPFEDCLPSSEERGWARRRLLGRSDIPWLEEARAALATALDVDR